MVLEMLLRVTSKLEHDAEVGLFLARGRRALDEFNTYHCIGHLDSGYLHSSFSLRLTSTTGARQNTYNPIDSAR